MNVPLIIIKLLSDVKDVDSAAQLDIRKKVNFVKDVLIHVITEQLKLKMEDVNKPVMYVLME